MHLAGPRSGVGRYTEGLIRALPEVAPENEYTVFYGAAIGRRVEDIQVDTNGNVRHVFLPRIPTLALKTLVKVWPWTAASRWFPPHDVYHETNYLPLVRGRRAVNTIYDLSYRACPEFHPARRVLVYRSFERRMSDVAYIITISEHARGEIIDALGIAADRVVTVYPGCDPAFHPHHAPDAIRDCRRRYTLEGPYLLFVGTLEPRKNIVGLLHAYHRARAEGGVTIPLVLAGGRGWRFDGIFAAITSLGFPKDAVRILEYVPHADLPLLYAGALALAFPSFYEGFGFPPLEAMASGCPVVTSNASSLPEVVGEAAIQVDPHDIDALAGAISRLVADPDLRLELRARGLEQAARFRWTDAARRVIDVYRKVAA